MKSVIAKKGSREKRWTIMAGLRFQPLLLKFLRILALLNWSEVFIQIFEIFITIGYYNRNLYIYMIELAYRIQDIFGLRLDLV